VTTACNLPEMKDFYRFLLRKLRMISIALLIFMAVVALVLISMSVRPPLMLGIVILFPVILLLLSSGVFFDKKQHEQSTKLMKNGQFFRFRNNDFIVTAEHPEYSYQIFMSYDVLEKVCERQDVFYLFVNNNQAHLVSKHGFHNAGAEELRALLQSKIKPNLYIKF